MSHEIAQTEERDTGGAALDTLNTRQLVRALARAGHDAADALVAAADALACVIDETVQRLQQGGRLHYVGAGTSGRLGVLDASEMGPTFGTPPELVCAHIAGGDVALRSAVEGAEDDCEAGRREMQSHVRTSDVVVALSASGNAAFAVGALAASREIGAYTVAIINNEPCALVAHADYVVVLRTGAEILMGSTRLKAGTAQKLALNALSTAVMVGLGHVYKNMMIDLVASNRKLRARALRIVEEVGNVDQKRAQELVLAADGRVKVAIVMARLGLNVPRAAAILAQNRGNLRDALEHKDA